MRVRWWILAAVACKSQPAPPPDKDPPPKIEAPVAPPPVALPSTATGAAPNGPVVFSKPEELDVVLAHAASASAIDVTDRWHGGGPTRTIKFRIERQAKGFVVQDAKKRVVRREAVEAFLKAVARKIDDDQSHHRGNLKPDDYPEIRVVLTIPDRGEVTLAVDDDQRHWTANGFFLEPDATSAGGDVIARDFHKKINAAYVQLRDAATSRAP